MAGFEQGRQPGRHGDAEVRLAGERTLGKRNHRELDHEPDGSFSVLIGPTVSGRNTITTDETGGSLMTREFFAHDDPARREARWTIEVVEGVQCSPESH